MDGSKVQSRFTKYVRACIVSVLGFGPIEGGGISLEEERLDQVLKVGSEAAQSDRHFSAAATTRQHKPPVRHDEPMMEML